jgi:uncharacterized membrane protein
MSDQITKSIIVRGDVSTVFDVWSDYETFPNYMTYVSHVIKTGPRTSRWEVAGPMGIKMEWTAETTRFEPDQRIAWNTKDHDGSMTTSGEVVFSELPDNQTHVTVTMNYTVPGGKAGEALAALFSDPGKRLEEDLRNFKAYIENGLY